MSRCFPFPPPGYENKARSDHLDLLAKEKHKEKRHKKEKKDKEKRDDKERKDKDRSKDKHREKKDRKEKHKDKKRDKDRDKGKHRADDRRIEGRTEVHNEDKLADSSHKAEETKNSKFTEELDRRIRDEEKGAAHRMFENSTGSIQRSAEGLGAAIAIEKERSNGNKMVGVLVTKEQRSNDGMGRPAEKNASKKIEGKEKVKDKEKNDRKGDRHRDRDREEKKSKGKDNHRHKEKEKEKKTEKNGVKIEENDTPKECGKKEQIDSLNFKPDEDKCIGADGNTTKRKDLEMNGLLLGECIGADGNIKKRKDKDEDKCIGADGNIKKRKDKDEDKCIGTDGNIKKRKDFEMNGFLLESNEQPNKFPRPADSSHTHVENGRTLESFTPNSSIGHQARNNVKSERVLDNKEHKINGTSVAQPSSVGSRPSDTIDTCHNAEASLRPPHPDTKYLNRIYSIPKVEEWPESDDQEWLFSSDKSRTKPKAESEVEGTPQVWAEVLQIQSADAFALPYVIPY